MCSPAPTFARASAPRRLFADRSAAEVVTGSDGMFGFIAGSAQEKQKIPSSPHHEIDNPDIGTVPDIMSGRWVGRANDQQITFLNNQGTQGLQFAAVGGTAYNLAKKKDLAIRCRWNGLRRISETRKNSEK